MEEIKIDLTRYLAENRPMPMDHHFGYWTFIIDGHPVSVFGTYSEARNIAKLYVRMYDTATSQVELDRFNTTGRVRQHAT